MRTLLTLCFVGIVSLSAQDHILFHDDFTLDAFRWPLQVTDTSTAELKNGQLFLQHDPLAGSYLFTHEVHLKSQADFSLSTQLTLEPGYTSNSYGLCWSANEAQTSYYAFLLKSEGFFAIVEIVEGKATFLQNWTRHRKIKEAGEVNELLVRKQGWRLYFLINGKEVHDLAFPKLRGRYHGLVIWQRAALIVDHFTIHHPPQSIHTVSGPMLKARKLPLDSTINQPHTHETHPILNSAGDRLYFTRSDSADWLRKGDIWESEVQGDSMWGEAVQLPDPINNADRNLVVQLSSSGQRMWLGSHYFLDGSANGPGLSVSQNAMRGENQWSIPQEIIIPGYQAEKVPVSWSMSQDQQVLIFSAQLDDSYGESDLYVSFLVNGKWSKPKNLGPAINTFATEMTPYLEADNKTLYFSSNGHPGYGAGDVYRTKRQSNTWTQWSVAENLGPRINSPEWDACYTPLPNRPRHAYMATVDTTHGTYDLFGVRIPEDIRDLPMVRVFGKVRNRKTEELLGATVHSFDLSPDSTTKQTVASEETGTYSLFLPYGKAYQLYPDRLGFYSIIDTLDVRPVKSYREIQLDLYLAPIEIGETIQLDRVYFHRATANLIETSYPELDRLLYLMRALPSLQIEIRGHTDNIGSEAELWTLSGQRAQVVRQYLTARGIRPERTLSRGYGATMPIASNVDPETRKLNRRVEFYIVRR